MKKNIKIGDKECIFYMEITPQEQEEISTMLTKWSMSMPDLKDKTMENLSNNNRGSTICTSKRILVLVGPQTSKAELLNTLAHEIRHVVDFVCADGELSPAQITGLIFSHFSDWV